MTDLKRPDLTEVESLLAARQRLADWLDKLEAAGSKTPPAVRDRVKTDYQGRLSQIVEEIRGHSDVINASLQGLRSQAEEFAALRTEEQETLAEAELRHVVGEYADDEWQRVEKDCSGKLGGLDEELGRLAGEIGRLEEVLSQIAPKPGEAASKPAPRRDPEPIHPARIVEAVATAQVREAPVARSPEPSAPIEPLEAPRFVPRGGLKSRDSGPAKSIPFPNLPAKDPNPASSPSVDEMTFLKSVVLEGGRGVANATTAPTPTETRVDRPTQSIAKTLKCGECGSLNRPTEWYCERCGAELAAV